MSPHGIAEQNMPADVIECCRKGKSVVPAWNSMADVIGCTRVIESCKKGKSAGPAWDSGAARCTGKLWNTLTDVIGRSRNGQPSTHIT